MLSNDLASGHHWSLPGWILGSILFDIFRKDLGDKNDCTLAKFVGDTKVEGEINKPERRATTQKYVS